MDKAVGRTLVAGAGVSGIRAALDLAQTGYKVLLVDSCDHTGGLLCKLDYQFPTSRCGFCRMLPLFDRDSSSQHCLRKGLSHDNIQILVSTQIIGIEGEPGNFKVTLKQNPPVIDPDLCTGCGECVQACPVRVPDPFNEGLTLRKAVYLPCPQSFPDRYTIDYAACSGCGECEAVCSAGAIKFVDQDRAKFRILVVDDEKIVRDSTGEWLKEEGFFVETADSGTAALDMLEHDSFNMMLTDIKMPGMDGVELLAKAKAVNPDICVIMMTAYAAVDSAVEAMKQGALDYLTKPFDPDVLISMVTNAYREFEMAQARVETVDSVILAGGTEFFRPDMTKNPYGYGMFPAVMTALEFERMISGTGPGSAGKGKTLVHPVTGKAVKKIAWFQCVGSRDSQTRTVFCSSICCMMSIKEAVLAKEKFGPEIETAIFYMDMRTFGKSFDLYRKDARDNMGVRFVRARVHSLTPVAEPDNHAVVARYAEMNGKIREEKFDLVVLATGQKPASQLTALAMKNNIETNEWGFVRTLPFSANLTPREGIIAAGSFSGLKDIGESVTCASAAACAACNLMHKAGRVRVQDMENPGNALWDTKELARENPRILTVLCSCSRIMEAESDIEAVKSGLSGIPELDAIEIMQDLCTDEAWFELAEQIRKKRPNRLVMGACLPCIRKNRLSELAEQSGLPVFLMETMDMAGLCSDSILRRLKILISGAGFKNPDVVERVPVKPAALVVGGGIAGLTAALGIADSGFHVDLVEKTNELGGNLLWMDTDINNNDIAGFCKAIVKRAESHKNIKIHKNTVVAAAVNRPGEFMSILNRQGAGPESIRHSVTVFATGGDQAEPEFDSGHDETGKIEMTQKQFELGLHNNKIVPEQLETIVMIQCSGTRNEKRPYCSRVCCIRALKHALELKKKNPGIQVYILYRDMMSYGFYEKYHIKARQAGVVFMQYEPSSFPEIAVENGKAIVRTRDSVLDMDVEINADCVVHATGIVPATDIDSLTGQYGADLDRFNFVREADSKFRPVDTMNYRAFACGLALKPCTIEEALSSAGAAAARAIRILSHDCLVSGKSVSATRTATCSLCEICVDACPYGARFVNKIEEKIEVDPAACQGCGVCAAMCPSDSAFVEGFYGQQIMDIIDIALS
jgi:heterodisulfide reductase subunit A